MRAYRPWLAYLSKLELGHDPSRKEGLLFIHGYNVSFDAAPPSHASGTA